MYYRSMNKCIVAILMLFTLSNGMLAQVTLTGKVVDSNSGLPIQGAELFDDISKVIVVTDEEGVFMMQDLQKGTHVVTCFLTNYNVTTVVVELENNEEINLELEPLSYNLTAVEIASKREEFFAMKRKKDVEGTSIYAGKKTEVVVLDLIKGNLASNKSRQIYAQVSGLNIYEGNEGGLQLAIGGRGLDPNRTSNFNTRQNGYDISADVLGYPESYYTPPSESLSEISVIRGASSLQYGSQFGGLINFKIRSIPSYKKLEIRSNQTYGSNNFYNSFNAIGFNLNQLKVNAFYNYKRGDGFRDNSEFYAHNAFVQAEYKLGSQTKISGELTYLNYLAKQAGGLTDQQFESNPQLSTRERNWFNVDWKLINFKIQHAFGEKSKMSLSLFGLDAQRNTVGFRGNPINLNENPITAVDEKDQNGNFILPRDLIKGSFKNYGAELKFLSQYNISDKKSVFLIGAKYYNSSNTSFQGPSSSFVDADFESQASLFPDYPSQSDFEFPNLNFAIFGENIIYLNDKFSITPGFRYEYILTRSMGQYNQVVFDNAGNAIANNLIEEDKELGRSFALFGLGLNYKMSERLIINANISQNYRSVTFSDIRVVSPSFIVDPNIKDESGYTADLGVKGRVNKLLSYDLGVYSILYNDRIGIILDDRANRVRKNIGKAIIGGFESLIDINLAHLINDKSRLLKLNWFANTALTFSEYLESEENNVVGNQVEFIPKVNLKTGITWGYKNFSSTLQYTYLSRQFTDVQNSLASLENDKQSGIVGDIPSYMVFDLTASYEFKSLRLEGGFNNLLNSYYFTQRATGYPGPGIIPSSGRTFFITLGYKY